MLLFVVVVFAAVVVYYCLFALAIEIFPLGLSLLAVVTAMVRDGVIVVGVLIVVMVHRCLILFGWVRGWVGSGSVGLVVRCLACVGCGARENLKI